MSRVAILLEFPTLNGGERSMLAALESLQRDRDFSTRIDPLLFAPSHGPLAAAIAALGLAHVPFACRDDHDRRRPMAELQQELLNLVEVHRPALLHANSLAMGRLTGSVAPRLAIPTSAHLRDVVKLSAAAVADLDRNARLLAVSNATRDFHIAQGLHPDRVSTVYNGVDLARFAPHARTGFLRDDLGLPPDSLLAATVGQICLRKGHDTLAAAVVLAAAAVPSLHFVILGERYSQKDESIEFERAFVAAFESNGLRSRLHRLGYRPDVERVLPEVDLLVHPARQEPLGRVLLEAAACGVAIVATDVGGTGEILADGESVRLVPPNDPQRLADAVVSLANDPARRLSLGHRARETIERKFDVSAAAKSLVREWEAIMESR